MVQYLGVTERHNTIRVPDLADVLIRCSRDWTSGKQFERLSLEDGAATESGLVLLLNDSFAQLNAWMLLGFPFNA